MLFYIYVFLLFIAFAHSSYGLILFIIAKSTPQKNLKTNNTNLPFFTIQLPIFNEENVIESLFESVTSIDYPTKKLQFQFLDDSTDNTSTLLNNLIKNSGLNNIEHIQRNSRVGYKAGALNNGLKTAKGDFIAIFDADFSPQPNFLKEIVKHITPEYDCYQAKWSYLNANDSLLTKAQKLNLDHHFNIFQYSRFNSNNLLNFNGTAGIWSMRALRDLGYWGEDTIAEDLDLSIKAQLADYKIKYIPSIECKSELPLNFGDLETQQKRWIKGSAQVLRKQFVNILKSNLSNSQKIHSLIFLNYNAIFPVILLISILNHPIYLENLTRGSDLSSLNIFLLGGLFINLQHFIAQKYNIKKLIYLPFLMVASVGLCISLSFSFISGLFDKNAEFKRTPKSKDKGSNSNKSPLPLYSLLEFLLLGYYLNFSYNLIINHNFIALAFQGIFLFGYLLICIKRLRSRFS